MLLRKMFFLLAVLSLIVLMTGAAQAQLAAPPADIELAYHGSGDSLQNLAKSVDWDAIRKGLAEKREIPNKMLIPPGANKRLDEARGEDPVRQIFHKLGFGTTPSLKLDFEGTSDQDNGEQTGFVTVPPDTNGDVGRDYYAQMNNVVFEIFNKSDGSSVLGPLPNNIFFAGTGAFCEQVNDGDSLVLYDHEAKRWIFTQFALLDANLNSHQCFAVSQTSDPTGAYYLYDFVVSVPFFGGIAAINDYPKFGVWPTGYFGSINEFEFFPGFGFDFVGASAVVFDRTAMLAGAPAGGVKFFILPDAAGNFFFSLQPSHWEGILPPPHAELTFSEPLKTADNIYIMAFDSETWGNIGDPDGYYHWAFEADFASNTFSLTDLGLIPSPEFDSNLCNFAPCVPQPAPGDLLDSASQFTMYRAAYRNFGLVFRDPGLGLHETIVISHTVNADGNDTAGVRWAELRNNGSGFEVHQTGTFAPDDGEHRWMSSIAINAIGDIALGYSVSSENTFPSIRMTGRKFFDSPGDMGNEIECFAGTGSQISDPTFGGGERWGDYSAMSVDPSDQTTFWYTQEYYADTNSFDFKTRVCKFKIKLGFF